MRNSRKRQKVNAATIAGDLMLTPWVMWMRTPMMARELSKSPMSRTESMRAVTEKVAAVQEGMANAQLAYFRALTSFWPEVISGSTPTVLSGVAAERVINAALKPSSRRVKSNFKRLGKS